MLVLGHSEYDKQWCLSELQKSDIIIEKDDNVALLKDFLNTYRKSEIEEGGNTKYDIGCCKVPKGAKRISRSKNCIYTPKYTMPSNFEMIGYFLKRFK